MTLSKPIILRILVLAAILAAAAFIYPAAVEHINLAALSEREADIRAGQAARPFLFFAIAFIIYTLAIAVALPGSSSFSIVTGWIFGTWMGIPLVSFASTLGALIAFLVARYCLRGLIERRFAGPLKKFEARFGDDCPYCLFSLRLMPGIPNFLINIIPSFTAMRARTFWWVSQLGMLPGTIAFVYVGSNLPSLERIAEEGMRGLISPGLIIGFAILGLMPLLIRFLTGRFGRAAITEPAPPTPE